MGRIRTQLIKRKTHELIREYGDEFKNNFEENKKLVEKFANIPSKKLRNIIAGYVTRLTKTKEEL
ncbi:30S ribosomal protein S17e [Candidatus Woesearchaeota archaeon]|nr:MAG: 30S ribosomal protein S17e [Candidatus Woesearchaeota archaeon]